MSQRTPAGDAFSKLVIQIFQLNNALVTAGDWLAEPTGQTSARWQALAGVEDEPRTVAQIARLLGLTRQSVQRVANLLVEDGLAIYEDNPNDKRAQLMRLTEDGRDALSLIQARQRLWANSIGEAVGAEALWEANKIMEQVLEAVSEEVKIIL